MRQYRKRDLEELLGEVEDDEEDISNRNEDVYKLAGGVSVQWLARAFRTTRHVVDKKLMGLRPIGKGKHGNPLYDFVQAAELLVTPRIDVEKYIAGLKPDQLPEKLRESYWNSMLKRQRWEEKAGHLWRTDRVIERISEMLIEVRSVLQILPEEIEREAGLSEEQHGVARRVVDGLQNKLYDHLVKFSNNGFTPNQLGDEGVVEAEDDDEDLL